MPMRWKGKVFHFPSSGAREGSTVKRKKHRAKKEGARENVNMRKIRCDEGRSRSKDDEEAPRE